MEGLCDSLAPRAATARETALVHSASLLVGQDISIPKVRASMCSTEASRTPTNDFTLSPEVAVGVVASLYIVRLYSLRLSERSPSLGGQLVTSARMTSVYIGRAQAPSSMDLGIDTPC